MKPKPRWTDKTLATLRKELIITYYRENRESPKEITCDSCQLEVKLDCPFAYDPYNTDGDCLGEK